MSLKSLVIVKVDPNTEEEIILNCPQDYIIDFDNAEIITKQPLEENERLIARNYSIDYDVHKAITILRAKLGDLKRDDRTYSNEELIEGFRSGLLQISGKFGWDIRIDRNGAIRWYQNNVIVSDSVIEVISSQAAINIFDATIQEYIKNAILIKEGKTTLDTSKGLGPSIELLKLKINEFKQRIESFAMDSIIDLDGFAFGDKYDPFMDKYNLVSNFNEIRNT